MYPSFWGCESWTIQEANLKELEVFLNRNIKKILKIDTIRVKDKQILDDFDNFGDNASNLQTSIHCLLDLPR